MNQFLNTISVASAFIFAVGILYLILDLTIGKIKIIQSNRILYGFQVKDAVFLVLSVIFILNFVSFYRPY